MSEHKDLNGLWTGDYGYRGQDEHVPFTAWLDDSGGHVSGTTLEPNTITLMGPEELEADLSGQRTGAAITFTKAYAPGTGIHQQPVRYEGTVSSDFTLISGHWFFDDLGDYTGPFTMRRSSGGLEQAVMRKESIKVSNRRR